MGSGPKRLTVLFDPSRVKTDLYANQRLGRALVEGQVYRIKIDSLQDIDGQSMPTAYEKRFYVIDKDTLHPDPKKWRKDLPLPNSQEALVLHFPDPLDHLSLLQRVVLTDSLNRPVKGKIQIIQKERAWRFNPSQNWYRGRYFIYVHPALEDPSGNNLGGAFERQVGISDPKDSIPIVKLEIVLNQVQKIRSMICHHSSSNPISYTKHENQSNTSPFKTAYFDRFASADKRV